MKIELTQKDKKRLVSLALAGALTTGLPTMASAETTVKAPFVGEVQTEVDYTEYVVQEGDTLGGIAEKLRGNAGYWEQIYELNKDEYPNPNVLFAGDVIKIPNRLIPINCNAVITQNDDVIYAESTVYPEDEKYVVQEGDTMCCIVNKILGRNDLLTVDRLTTYNEIAGRMDHDPNKIYVGQELLIPCIEKLDNVVPYDYTEQYAELEWRLNHPECNYVWNDCNQKIIWIWNECNQPLPPCPPKDLPEPHCHHRRVLKP